MTIKINRVSIQAEININFDEDTRIFQSSDRLI